MINPTRRSAIIVGNVIAGSDDHGVVLRDKGYPVMMNNLIYDCRNAGVAVENSCEALLVNNTMVNCMIWNCQRPITLTDSSNTDIEDRGSHITIRYSDIEGGRDGVSISGTYSTLTWQEGNLNVDPLYASPDARDYHLISESGRWDPDGRSWDRGRVTSPCIDAGDPNSDWSAELWTHGKRINLGAFGGTPEAGMSRSMTGSAADLNNDDAIDAKDLYLLTDQWLMDHILLIEDINRDGVVTLPNFALLIDDWFDLR
ncbi:MAG: right-handed parallel beta-helix repeat-containing protein [Sedimentisphaerales bacterium]|nr:right-handed parallel beta-helix repeat-containing protein [Sedimentisphaerales bacterium]